MTRRLRHLRLDPPTDTDINVRDDEGDPMDRQARYDEIDRASSLRRDRQYQMLEDHARSAGDTAHAAFWAQQRVSCDYAALPPGMTRARLLEIAGLTGAAGAPDTPAPYLRGVLVAHLLNIIARAESPELRLDAVDVEANEIERRFAGTQGRERADAAERARSEQLADGWNNQAMRHVAKSTELLADRAPTTLEAARAKSAAAVRHDEQPADVRWGDEWRREPRSAAFVRDELREPQRRGGMAIADVMDADDADQPLLELQGR